MAKSEQEHFAYAHDAAILSALRVAVSKRCYIRDDYAYLEKTGEREMFDAMLEVARMGKGDILHVDSVKEFAGASLAEFKSALTAIHDAGMVVFSLSEERYNYTAFMTAIEVLEGLMPDYQKKRQSIEAVALCKVGVAVDEICKLTGLSEADVHQAVADYMREQEQTEE